MARTTSSTSDLNHLGESTNDGDSSCGPNGENSRIAHVPKFSGDRRSRSPRARSDAGIRRRSQSPRPHQLHDTASSSPIADPMQGNEDAPDIIEMESMNLRRHLGLSETPGMLARGSSGPVPSFFIERAPDSRRSAKCKLPTCSAVVEPRKYRLVLHPGMDIGHWAQKSGNMDHQEATTWTTLF